MAGAGARAWGDLAGVNYMLMSLHSDVLMQNECLQKSGLC